MMLLSASQAVATSVVAGPSNSSFPSSRNSSGLRQVSWQWQRQNGVQELRAAGCSKASAPTNPKGVGIRCEVQSVTQDNFETEVLQSELPVLVDFWATWCGPCKLVASSLDVVDGKYKGKLKVVKVETDPNPRLVEKYKVYGLPTLIVFRDGKVMEGGRSEGAISLGKIESIIKKVLPSVAGANLGQ